MHAALRDTIKHTCQEGFYTCSVGTHLVDVAVLLYGSRIVRRVRRRIALGLLEGCTRAASCSRAPQRVA